MGTIGAVGSDSLKKKQKKQKKQKSKRTTAYPFHTDPFYLYPIQKDLIGHLFIDREEEIQILKGILGLAFDSIQEICAIIGGIGVGKSSMLHYIEKLAHEHGYSYSFYNKLSDFYSASGEEHGTRIQLIDNIDKSIDEKAHEFYVFIEQYIQKHNGFLFFSDVYVRSKDTLALRNFTVSQVITLPQGLSKDQLRSFLLERFRRCLPNTSELIFPFSDEAITMAATRSDGNLRRFLTYCKSAWMIASAKEPIQVTTDEMKTSVINIDRTFLGVCDLIDLRILWNATIGDMNKTYLSHQCGIDIKTLDHHIGEHLGDFIEQRRSGKEIMVTSIYHPLLDGKEILKQIMNGLGISLSDIETA